MENVAVIRHVALKLLRREKTNKRNIKLERKRYGFSRAYLLTVMGASAQAPTRSSPLKASTSAHGSPRRSQRAADFDRRARLAKSQRNALSLRQTLGPPIKEAETLPPSCSNLPLPPLV